MSEQQKRKGVKIVEKGLEGMKMVEDENGGG